MSQNNMMPKPAITTTATTAGTPYGQFIQQSQQNGPTNWNIAADKSSFSFPPRVEECQSEMIFNNGRTTGSLKFTAPPPNIIRRFIWKWALGVTWRDLRPERDLETLRGLK